MHVFKRQLLILIKEATGMTGTHVDRDQKCSDGDDPCRLICQSPCPNSI